MNTNPGARRRRFVIATVAALALVGGALALAIALRSTSHHATPAAVPRQEALAYAQCMRGNGVPDFPDPEPNGRFRGLSHEQQDDPKFQAAQETCRDLAPGGEHEQFGNPAFVAEARAFAQCIRANGVPDFPDPDAEGRFRGVGHEQQDNPRFRAAFETCREKLLGGGAHQ